MYCSYHPVATAAVQCSHCGRPLCPSCDHRIKGYAYCQDCIVQGVARLSQPFYSHGPASSTLTIGKPKTAALFSMIPGLGAVYNRQNVKALVQFIVTFGLFQMAGITGLPFFGFGGMIFWLYTIFDSYRTAEALRSGHDLSHQEEHLKKLLRENTTSWGILLIGLGAIFLLSNLDLFNFPTVVQRIWPLLFVLLGFYFLRDSSKKSKVDEVNFQRSVPRSVVTSTLISPSVAASRTEGSPVETHPRGNGA